MTIGQIWVVVGLVAIVACAWFDRAILSLPGGFFILFAWVIPFGWGLLLICSAVLKWWLERQG